MDGKAGLVVSMPHRNLFAVGCALRSDRGSLARKSPPHLLSFSLLLRGKIAHQEYYIFGKLPVRSLTGSQVVKLHALQS